MARHDAPQQARNGYAKGLAVPTSEEEVSDRDMPELAPICPPPPQPSEQPVPAQIRKKPSQDDLEADLGQKLSPLGSTSSIQDLIESNSAGEMVSESQNSFTWTTLERQKMAKSSEFAMPEETADNLQVVHENGKSNLSAAEDNSEDAEEHVTSYLEQPPIKILEKKFTEEEDDGNEHSRKSSSSGSYSVTSALAGQHVPKVEKGISDILVLEQQQELKQFIIPEDFIPPIEQEPVIEQIESMQEIIQQVTQDVAKEELKEVSAEQETSIQLQQESQPTPAMIRKTELTLDLQKEAGSIPFKVPQDITSSFSPDESSSENSMMWQRLPLGTGDVQKKRQAFERQIKCLSEDTKPRVLNGKVKTPSSGGVRKIVSEERAGGPLTGAGGLARSPAMHSGFRTEEWVVERTPVNTPVNDRVLVGMINLSDEENSFRGSSEDLCKSSGATTPQGSINSSSFAPSTLDLTKTDTEKTQEIQEEVVCEHAQNAEIHHDIKQEDETPSQPQTEEIKAKDETDFQPKLLPQGEPEKPVLAEPIKLADQPAPTVPLMAPPAGFGDSPEHVPHKRMPGFHEALTDQVQSLKNKTSNIR